MVSKGVSNKIPKKHIIWTLAHPHNKAYEIWSFDALAMTELHTMFIKKIARNEGPYSII